MATVIPVKPGAISKGKANWLNQSTHLFSLQATSNLYLRLDGLGTDLDLYLGSVSASGKLDTIVLQSSTNPGLERESIFAQLKPGKYYLRIKNPTDTANRNKLNYSYELNAAEFDKTTRLSNDPLLTQQWHLFNTGSLQLGSNSNVVSLANVDIAAPEAWAIRHDASAIIVAVIDEGIDLKHPDLIDNLWTNKGEIAANGIDDDDNGYVDDIHGWNFRAKNNTSNTGVSHGTHVAGIIGASGNNNLGISGVAWKTQLMSLDVFDGNDQESMQDVAEAITYAVKQGAKVINLSLGEERKIAPHSFLKSAEAKIYRQAFQYAYANDVFISIAAGNSGSNFSDIQGYQGIGNLDQYASIPSLFSLEFGNIANVIASNASAHKADYSNFGLSALISAPGGSGQSVYSGNNSNGNSTYVATPALKILSTVAVGTGKHADQGVGRDYDYMNGTSMASPVIAGMAALIRAENRSIRAPETLAILRAGARPVSQLKTLVDDGLTADLQASLNIAKTWKGPDSLTQIGQDRAPIFNLSSLSSAQQIKGTLQVSKKLPFDAITGFYRVLDLEGSVMDATGRLVKPGDAQYSSIALNPSNTVSDIEVKSPQGSRNQTRSFTLGESNILAPYAKVGPNTWFAYSKANPAQSRRFKTLAPNTFGLEIHNTRQLNDFQDLILTFSSSQIL